MPYPERLLSPGERVVREFRPHWRAILMPISLSVVALVALVAVVASPAPAPDVRRWLVPVILVAWALVTWPPLVKWWFTGYVVTTERLVIRTGVFSRAGKEIPLEVINDVAFSQQLVERIFRSGDLLVESAGEQGQSRFHDIPDPEELQSVVYRLREDRMIALKGRGRDATEQLEALVRLHQDGVLTDEEFQAKKSKLLGEI